MGCAVWRWFGLDLERPELPQVERWFNVLKQRPAYQSVVLLPLT
jgi:glutathione S-transferase